MVTQRRRLRLNIQTVLTTVISLGWIASFIVRLSRPDWPPGPAVDAIMLVVVSYWFAAQAMRRPTNGNGGGDK